MGKNKNQKNQRMKNPQTNRNINNSVDGGRFASVDIVRIVCCIVAVACILLCIASVVYDARLKITPQVVTDPVAEEYSQFKTEFYNEVEKLAPKGAFYDVVEKYYDEYVIKTYVSVISGIEEPTIDNIIPYIEDLFYFERDGRIYSLIQKDSYTLVAQTEDKALMNTLDYRLLGLSNDEIQKVSKGFYISQNNPEFLDMKYGSVNVNTSGCGPVCMTMALNYNAGEQIVTLEEVVAWANENNMYEENSGTKWVFMTAYPPVAGSQVTAFPAYTPEALERSLADGGVLITSMKPGSSFTDNGHFVVITEVKDGKVRVLDPASIYRSLEVWDINVILNDSVGTYWKIYR